MTGVLGILILSVAARPAATTRASALLASARSALDSGRCEEASRLFLSARQAGDSSMVPVLGLARSMECLGRMEEALGATYVEIKGDSAGKVDLMLERIRVLRRLGLEDLAKQSEKEIGIFLVGSGANAGHAGWVWNKVPSLALSVGWNDQSDRPHLASLPRHNDSLLSPDLQSSSVPQALVDSITLEGGCLQTSASLNWGGGGSTGGMWLGPSGNLSLADDSLAWRSVDGGLDFSGYWLATQMLTLQAGFSGSRTWFAAESGPIPTQDDLVASLFPVLARDGWEVSLPQTLHALRTNSGPWTWAGIHGVGVSRGVVPKVKVSAGGSWGWNIDPLGAVDDAVVARVYEGQWLDTTSILRNSYLYTAGGQLTNNRFETSRVRSDSIATDSEIQVLGVPASRNADWTQTGLNMRATIGPWASLTLDFSLQWTRTDYLHDQEGVLVDQSLALVKNYTVAGEQNTVPALVVLRDSTTKNEYVLGENSASASLVPWFWKIHRRDQCWTTQATATWRPRRWLNLRASWTWSRNISNLEDYVDGASYFRNVVSFAGAVSW